MEVLDPVLNKFQLYAEPNVLSGLADMSQFPRDFLDASSPRLDVFDLSGQDNRNNPVAMCFSSGTSGSPKGVLISHYNLIAYALTLRSTSPTTANSDASEVFFPSCR